MNKYTILFVLSLLGCSLSISKETDSKIKAIGEYLETLEKKDAVSGVILITKDDEVVLQKEYGYAHIGHKVPIKFNTKFSFASIGKTFTAIAILQLMEQKKLSLTDTVGKHLSDYPNKVVREEVTIEQLLNHTSGIPNYMTEEFYQSSKDLYRNLDDLADLYQMQALHFSPGESYSYTNSGYVILGLIIEELSNKKYDEYIRENIFDVAGMKNTGNFDRDHPVTDSAEGYTLSEIQPHSWKKNTLLGSVRGGPAGGGYTTAEDLNAFIKALLSYKFLTKEATSMLTSQNDPKQRYGYGIQFFSNDNHKVYGHSGGHFGVATEWSVYDDLGYKVIILTNRDAEQGFYDIRYSIREQLTGASSVTESYFFTNKIIDTALEQGYDAALELINESDVEAFEGVINYKGYQLLNQKKYKEAIALFKTQVYAFSESYNAYDSLAEAYMKQGNTSKAIENYSYSLKLNPKHIHAEEQLRKLKSSNKH